MLHHFISERYQIGSVWKDIYRVDDTVFDVLSHFPQVFQCTKRWDVKMKIEHHDGPLKSVEFTVRQRHGVSRSAIYGTGILRIVFVMFSGMLAQTVRQISKTQTKTLKASARRPCGRTFVVGLASRTEGTAMRRAPDLSR